MQKLLNSFIAMLHHRRKFFLAAIVFFWAIVFLMPYIIVRVVPEKYKPGWTLRPLLALDYGMGDTLARNARGAEPDPDIVFLGIDDISSRLDSVDPEDIQSNHALSLMTKPWPWSREIYALLLDRLCDSGAKAVIFDVLWTTTSPDDPLLKASLDRHADRVVASCNLLDWENGLALPSSSLIEQTLPLDNRTALVNFWPDVDGVIRRARFHRTYQGSSVGEAESKYEIDSVATKVAGLVGKSALVPKDDANYMIRFTSARNQFLPVSVYEVFYPKYWERNFQNGAFFKDKIVMIGPSGNFRQDEHVTPLGGMDGAQIHLQALNAVLHHDFIFYTGDSLAWMILLVSLTSLAAWMLLVLIHRATTFCIGAIAFYAAYISAAIPVYSGGVLLAVGAPLGTFFASTLMGLSTQYILEQIERARTRRFFERYVSPNVVGEILDNPALYNESLVGRRREVTVLFSDLRGFTSMTEKADSEQLVRELNEYLEEMTKALFLHQGILDKFIGDAVMAVWGSFAPEPEIDTQNAVRAALAMIDELAALNVRRRERGLGVLGMGVGIHHGEAIVGDIGSEHAKNFTVIGDTVNLASRLEGVTKEYGVELVISESVEKLVRPYFHVQSLGFEIVKGRQKPVGIFTVLGSKDQPLPEERAAYLAQYEEAMAAYLNKDFVGAKRGFNACIKLAGQDPVSAVFIERCDEYEETPPPADWDGAHQMTRK